MEQKTLKSNEAALILGISEKTLRNWRTRGFGPKFVKYGRARSAPVRYRQSELERWLALQEYQGTFEYEAV